MSERLVLKVHPLACNGVSERDAFGVKVEAVGTGTIENVALDGTAKSFRMGAMDAKLMRAACLWI